MALKPKKKHKSKSDIQLECPECSEKLQRIVKEVYRHFLENHGKRLSAGEADRIAVPQGKHKVPYTEDLKRNFNEVQGGLPSLGKRR